MYYPSLGTFTTNRKTANGGTAFRQLVGYGPGRRTSFTPTGTMPAGIMKITSLRYVTGATAHTIGVMRPFNFTTFSADAAASQAVVNITADPGLYATAANWGYGAFGNTPRTANNAIAGSDVVVFQAADGTFILDTVSSVTSLAVTLTTSLPTGGVKSGGILWFFGVIGDSDPNTGDVNPQWLTTANADETWSDSWGIVTALHQGDPLVFYSPNTSNAGFLEMATGFVAKY